MTEPILVLKNIEKRFPGVHALRDVAFDVRPGEVHALLAVVNGFEVLLGAPFIFNKENINDFDF